MQNKKWLSFLIALLVAIGLWVYVVTVENPEGEDTLYNIPVNFSGEDVLREDYELIITGDNVTTSGVTLTFSGKRTDLKRLAENKDEIRVNVDVTRIRKANTYTYSYGVSNITLPASVASDSVSLIDRSPGTISVTVQKVAKKTVPVKLLTDIKLMDGYVHDRPLLDFEEITIEGPEDLISQIKQAQVILERENVDTSISATLPVTFIDLNDEAVNDPSITSDIAEIVVSVPVRMTKDVQLDVNFIDGGGATANDVTYTIDPPMLTLSGETTMLETLDSIKLPNIDLSSLMTNTEDVVCQIPIPEGCTNVSGVTEATVKVNIVNKTIRSLKATNIQIINPPEGISAVSKVSVLWVTLRVDASKADQLTEESLRVVADMSQVVIPEDATSAVVPVDIYVDGVDSVGAVGPQYSIIVELKSLDQTSTQ